MNLNTFSPYIRVATPATLISPCIIYPRVLLDYELIYIEEGKCMITYEGEEFVAKKNDVVFFRPNITHKIELFPGINLSQPHVHFDIDFDRYSAEVYVCFKNREDLSETDWRMMRKDIFSGMPQPSPIIRVSDPPLFRRLFYEIIEISRYKPPLHQITSKSRMIELLGLIIRDNFPDYFEESPGTAEFDMATVKNYIDFNFRNALSLEALSNQFNYNKYYILRRFRKRYGVTPIQYYNDLRLSEAQKLLDSHSVTEVADMLKFSSIYAFSRAFKGKYGLSPTQYRERLRSVPEPSDPESDGEGTVDKSVDL